jgi:hypothetical protein
MHLAKGHRPVGALVLPNPSSIKLRQKVRAIEAMAEGIRTAEVPAAMPVAAVKTLVDLATRVFNEYNKAATKAISSMPEIESRIRFSRNSIQDDFSRMIVGRIKNVIPGNTTLNGRIVVANVGLFLNSVAGGYEALAFFEDVRPGVLNLIPDSVMRVVVDIAEFVAEIAEFISEGLKAGIDAGRKATSSLIDLLKWGSVAGALYLLYGVLKEDKS